jgi:hypothetical protein
MPQKNGEILRFSSWIFLVFFFIFSPALDLYLTSLIARSISNSSSSHRLLLEIDNDAPIILFSFYSGVVGGIIAYVYDRIHRKRESDDVVTRISKLTFSGCMGTVAYFIINSAIFVKFFYPGIDISNVRSGSLNYQSIIVSCVIFGIIGSSIVRKLQKSAKN